MTEHFGGFHIAESWTGHNETNWVIHPNTAEQKAAARRYVQRYCGPDHEGCLELLAALGLDYEEAA